MVYIEINCKVCNKKFTTYKYLVEKHGKKYCSHACYSQDRTPQNKGRRWKISAEALAKRKELFATGKLVSPKGMLGKKASPETLLKMRLAHLGPKGSNWKGGITSESRLQRVKFRKVTQPLIFARDNYTCQICDQYSGYLQVDHIKSWKDYPELRFTLDNCRTLCMACHYYITFKRKMPEGIVWGHNLKQRIKP